MTEEPKVWLIRAQYGQWTDAFVDNGYIGIHYNLDNVDVTNVSSIDEFRRIYAQENPSVDSVHSIGNRSGQIARFHIDTKAGNYVLTPGIDRNEIRYGRFTSDTTYYTDGEDGLPCRNRKGVDWSPTRLSRRQLPEGMLNAQATVSEINNESHKARFFSLISATGLGIESLKPDLKLPEDSWVPFHLEVGKKLIEGEWWREEKRDEFARMVNDIRWIDPRDAGFSAGNKEWRPDPFSFYDSFSIWNTGPDGTHVHQKVKDLMGIEVNVPSEQQGSYGLHWGWHDPIDDEEISFLWDLFRFAVEFEPLSGDVNSERKFIEFYDRASSATFLPGKRARVWTYFLYWIDPTKYVIARRLRKKDLGLAVDLGVSEELRTGREYLKALKGIRELGFEHGFTMLDVNRKSTTREMLGLDPMIVPVNGVYGVDTMLDEGVFLERTDIDRMLRILRTKKNLILQGPPGVGKTFIARRLAYALIGRKDGDRVESVQFHQSYSYEDFVGGYRPDVVDRQMVFEPKDGPFLILCTAAKSESEDRFVLFIDEINRGNLSRVFGELLMLIEADKRSSEYAVRLQHRSDGADRFFVPNNVYIIGTMNLADRSLTGMNVAMRRRFGFFDLEPQFGKRAFTEWLADETEMPTEMRERINSRMKALNDDIAVDPSLGGNYAVGHSFFCPPKGDPEGGWEEWYETVVDYEIRPLLREYWFDAPDTANDHADKLLGKD